MGPRSNGHAYKTLPHIWLGNIAEERAERLQEPKDQGLCRDILFLVISEASLIKSRQHDCPNMSRTRVTPMDMPKGTGKGPYGPFTKSYGQMRKAGSREKSSPEKSAPVGCPVPKA